VVKTATWSPDDEPQPSTSTSTASKATSNQVDRSTSRGTVVDARCVGTLFRGFEQILIGRAPRRLVITPRLRHLRHGPPLCRRAGAGADRHCAARPRHAGAQPVPDGRNVQSDLRQSFLFFTPDFCNARYAGHPLCAD
jgi:hydrogenase large subunit